ncbi:hypothetical protein SDC9_163864 [bioreactor metagenome]|uniref:Uncharacterized protein n=1 Tax=bioreactor metagenome TaxID=1076179 RepID=A0A645FRK3_9ZZZZ
MHGAISRIGHERVRIDLAFGHQLDREFLAIHPEACIGIFEHVVWVVIPLRQPHHALEHDRVRGHKGIVGRQVIACDGVPAFDVGRLHHTFLVLVGCDQGHQLCLDGCLVHVRRFGIGRDNGVNLG